jgi:hypothetical protein
MKQILLAAVLFLALTITVDARKQTLNRQKTPLYAGGNMVTVSSQDIQIFTLAHRDYKVNDDLSLYCFLSTPSGNDRNYLTVSIITNLFTAQTGAKLLSPFFNNLYK